MADFRKMIPFICHFAAGVSGSSLALPYERMFELAKGTGWSNDPDDPGGMTQVDVTMQAYEQYCRRKGYPRPTPERLRNIPYRQWQDILKTMFWDKWRADDIRSQGIANLLVDWVWASGAKTIKNAQRIIGVTADGIAGPLTISAINSADPGALFASLKSERERYYRACAGFWKYGKGWLRRLDAILPDGRFLIYGKIYG